MTNFYWHCCFRHHVRKLTHPILVKHNNKINMRFFLKQCFSSFLEMFVVTNISIPVNTLIYSAYACPVPCGLTV